MMNGLPYYKAYPRDFIEGTVGMDFEVKAAYRLVLDLIYMHGGRLVDDARFIAGHLGCSVKKWNGLRAKLIDAGKVQLSDGYLGNYRADKELEILGKFQDKQRENRSRPNKNKDLQSPSFDHTDTDTDTEEKEATNVASKKVRGSRLPGDWRLPKPWGEWALSQGMDEPSVRREADNFRDYWQSATGAKASKLDWEKTWRVWIRNKLSRSAGKPRAGFNPLNGDQRILPDGRTQVFTPNQGWVAVHV